MLGHSFHTRMIETMAKPDFRLGWQIFWGSLFGANATHVLIGWQQSARQEPGLLVSALGFLLLSYAGFRHPIILWPRNPPTLREYRIHDWLMLVGIAFIATGAWQLIGKGS